MFVRTAHRALCSGLAIAACLVAACGGTAEVERREIGLVGPAGAAAQAGGGDGWTLVLAPESGAAGGERARLDARLAGRERGSVYPIGMYPDPSNRLANARRLYLPRNAETVLYFSPGPGRPWWWY